MAPRKCCVKKCSTRDLIPGSTIPLKDERISMFKVPSDPELFQKWAQILIHYGTTLKRSHFICEKHFAVENLVRRFNSKKTFIVSRLLKTAVPILPNDLFKTDNNDSDDQGSFETLDGDYSIPTETNSEVNVEIPNSLDEENIIIYFYDEDKQTMNDNFEVFDPDKEIFKQDDSMKNCEETFLYKNESEDLNSIKHESMDIDSTKHEIEDIDSIKHESEDSNLIEHENEDIHLIYENKENIQCLDSNCGVQTSDEISKDSSEEITMTFLSIFNNAEKIQLPKSWCFQRVSEPYKMLIIAKLAAIVLDDKLIPIHEKQIIFDEMGDISIHIYNKLSDLSVEYPTSVEALESIAQEIDELIICEGGPSFREGKEKALPNAYVDDIQKWRHNSCELVVENSGKCSYCKTLRKSKKKKSQEEFFEIENLITDHNFKRRRKHSRS